MPRASWRGFLRLSLVSCPIYLSPATTRTKPIRLHQVWQPAPADVDEEVLPDRGGEQQSSERSVTRLHADSTAPDGEQSPVATRIRQVVLVHIRRRWLPHLLQANGFGACRRRRQVDRAGH